MEWDILLLHLFQNGDIRIELINKCKQRSIIIIFSTLRLHILLRDKLTEKVGANQV